MSKCSCGGRPVLAQGHALTVVGYAAGQLRPQLHCPRAAGPLKRCGLRNDSARQIRIIDLPEFNTRSCIIVLFTCPLRR